MAHGYCRPKFLLPCEVRCPMKNCCFAPFMACGALYNALFYFSHRESTKIYLLPLTLPSRSISYNFANNEAHALCWEVVSSHKCKASVQCDSVRVLTVREVLWPYSPSDRGFVPDVSEHLVLPLEPDGVDSDVSVHSLSLLSIHLVPIWRSKGIGICLTFHL